MAARARWAGCVVIFGLLVGGVAADAAAPATSTARERKTKTIQVQVSTEPWKGWGQGEAAPDGLAIERPEEKFTRFETPDGAAPSFSGKVIGIPPGKGAKIGVVANVGTQWIQPANYKFADVAPDGTFTIVADHKPDAQRKSLFVQVPGRLAHFLRAEFAPSESAKDVEFHLAETKAVVLTMSDAQGRDVRSFRVEAFTPYIVKDESGRAMQRIQRLLAAPSSSGAIVFESPLEPVAVLLSGGGVAPHYEVIDPREADEFHFKMIAPSRIRGVVTRDGQPVAGQEIYMTNRAAALSVTLRKTDAQGRFDFTGRVPGVQEIRIGSFRTSVRVEPGETTDLNLEIGAAASPSPAPAPAR